MSNIKSKKVKIGIIGLGMVGSPIKKWFEEVQGYRRGHELFCYDSDPKRGCTDNINKADVIFVAVPTPPNPDGSCDVSIVKSVVSGIKDGKVVIIKSTVTPGTAEGLQKKYPRKKIIFNPEFLTESQPWLDYIKPHRQIAGHTSKSFSQAKKILSFLPRANFERPIPIGLSKRGITATEAELIKYAGNVFGYLKVVYGNIWADISHALSINFKNKKIKSEVSYENIREAISADPRTGPAWLNVEHGNYCGAGGYCFPKDMNATIRFCEFLLEDMTSKTGRPTVDSAFLKTLEKGIGVFKAVVKYNEALLASQNLTIGDVSRHDKDVVLKKRKYIRRQWQKQD